MSRFQLICATNARIYYFNIQLFVSQFSERKYPMIIALEGAPATGKSTTAKHLAEHHGFFRVAETNELFAHRPDPEPEYWYCERQIERIELATKKQDSVLDGDPFQAAWFSWIYPDRGFSDWSKVMNYFMANAHAITLPTFYAYMHIDADERYRREKSRAKTRGHNHERFLKKWALYEDMPAPQQALFDAISARHPGWVVTLETDNLSRVVRTLLATQSLTSPKPEEFICWLADWLSQNNPDDFR